MLFSLFFRLIFSPIAAIFAFARFAAFFCAVFWAPLSYSAKVGKIIIQGNKIIETGLIRSHIQLKEGAPYKESIIQKDVRRLFSLGFFDEIEVRRIPSKKGLSLVYWLKERAPIGQAAFEGNDSLSSEDLKELSLVKEYSFLNFDQLKKSLSAIEEKYKEKGYYLAKASYETKKIPKEKRLKLIIKIKEGQKLLIKRVNFIGNRNIPSNKLKPFLLTKEAGLLSFLGLSGIFQPQRVERDLQFIEFYYRDQGYLNARAHPPEISISPDKKFLFINFPVSEGPRFKTGQLAFRGDEAVSSEQALSQLSLKEGEYFSLGALQKDIRLISLLYKNKGYAFANVQPQFYPDPAEEDKIHILFKAEKGSVYRLRRIKIFGNQNARDKVILRRFRLKEGDIYKESAKDLSQSLIQQLGYFEEVDLKPIPVLKEEREEWAVSGKKEEEKELDIEARVKERENTGEAHLAGGYNGETKLFINGGIKKQNFLGLDQSIALNLSFDKYREVFAFSYQNPYFFDSHWSFSADVFNVGQGALSGFGSDPFLFSRSPDYFSYFQINTGFSLSLGRHLTEFSSLFLKYRLQNQILSEERVYFLRDLPVLAPVFDFLFVGGEEEESQTEALFSDIYNLKSATGLNSSLFAIFEYDSRDDRYYASKGIFARLSAEYSGLGGDFNYSKLQGDFRHYYKPFWKLVIKNRLSLGFVFSNDKDKEPPFTELFLLGGPYNLRGFPLNSQAPRKSSAKAFDYAKRRFIEIEAGKEFLKEIQALPGGAPSGEDSSAPSIRSAVQPQTKPAAPAAPGADSLIQKYLSSGNLLPQTESSLKRLLSARAEGGLSDSEALAEAQSLAQHIVSAEETEEGKLLKKPDIFAQRPYGGQQMFFYSLEFEFPIIEKSELRGVFFFDLGEANGIEGGAGGLSFNFDDQLRADAGAGIRWRSPFGPIGLDFALPYRPKKEFGEDSWEIQFNMGAQF